MNLNQVTIPSSDISRSEAFYTKLGLKVIVRVDHYLRFECPNGDATFSVHLYDGEIGDNGTTIYFEVEDLDATVRALKDQGIHFDQDPTQQMWLWYEARLKDPDGNPMIIYHAGENRKNPPWRVKT